MAQYDKEKQELIEWLMHPNELGKAPAKIEFVKEFTDEEDVHCLIFKFKKGMLSPWMLAIHSDSGMFSEQEKYDPATDVEDAKKMVEYLKQYWKNIARNEEEKKERAERAKSFQGFILKKEAKFEPDAFLKLYAEDWGEKLEDTAPSEEEAREGVDARIYTNSQGMRVTLGYMDFKVPNEEAEANARYNYMWREAVEVTASHVAQEVVFVSGGDNVRNRAMLYSRVICTLCKMDNNIGLYSNGVVYNPEMITRMYNLIKGDELPLPVLVWIGICQGDTGISAWTDGMKNFGFDEMELLDSKMELQNLQGFMLLLVEYCLKNDISFHDEETVALSASMHLKVKKSKGYNVDEDAETLKLQML